jgi:hypothetical protein
MTIQRRETLYVGTAWIAAITGSVVAWRIIAGLVR